jgi:uncharacterized membrane protein
MLIIMMIGVDFSGIGMDLRLPLSCDAFVTPNRNQQRYHQHQKSSQNNDQSSGSFQFQFPSSSAILQKISSTRPLSSSSRWPMTPTVSSVILMGSMDPNVDPSSLISAKDDTTQQLAFVGIMIGILAGCFGFVAIYDWFEDILPPSIYQPFYSVLPYVLSSTFIAAGIAHFALEETFVAFVPPPGTWGGLWQIPAPFSQKLGLSYGKYHSFWSGLAEVVVSLSLIATTSQIVDLGPIPASLMFLLTLAVTPANIYMFTHNPDVPEIPVVPYPWGHFGRGVLQCALLAVFFKLAVHAG